MAINVPFLLLEEQGKFERGNSRGREIAAPLECRRSLDWKSVGSSILAKSGENEPKSIGLVIIYIMIIATVVKLPLWIYHMSSKNEIVQCAKDHYFDVVTNVVGLASAVFGDWLYWWIDPVGAILLAIYTIINWSRTALENAVSLVGQSAPPEMLTKLTYLAIRDPLMKRIETVRAYTFGVLYFVEVDVEVPENFSLKKANPIGQCLQTNYEKLPEVERAFVHLDHECRHAPEHCILNRLPSSSP